MGKKPGCGANFAVWDLAWGKALTFGGKFKADTWQTWQAISSVIGASRLAGAANPSRDGSQHRAGITGGLGRGVYSEAPRSRYGLGLPRTRKMVPILHCTR